MARACMRWLCSARASAPPGSATFPRRSRSYVAASNFARVVVIDEHYTSQRCSDCAFAEEPSHHRLDAGRCGDTHESGASGEIHGVRWCPECRKLWNRDVNAARNMRQVFLHMLAHGLSRPEGFRHPGALGSQPLAAAAAA